MLINRVNEEEGKSVSDKGDAGDNAEEYQTVNERFEILAKNSHNTVNENSAFTTRDLVILYKNIDLDSKPTTNSGEFINKKSNQYVETIIYKDENDSEDSEAYEIFSNEDLRNVFTINNERIDLLSNMPSFENTLCHKFGNIHMKSSDLRNEYGKHFLFNDPFIKEQLKSLHAMSDSKQCTNTILPASLLDYICSKRLEDNYGYYMDNVIKYVQQTIEQLKRISNGDYLTEKAKEKWREVGHVNKSNGSKTTSLVCTDKAILPLKTKVNKPESTWDEIVHSEMDVRCLRKFLEKKIILEVPKILCGSYILFTKQVKNSFVISCNKAKKTKKSKNAEKSNTNVVVTIQKSDPGSIISNIESVLVLKSLLPSVIKRGNQPRKLEYTNDEDFSIVEIDENGNDIFQERDSVIGVPTQKEISLSTDEMCNSEVNHSLIHFDKANYTLEEFSVQSALLEENEDFPIRKKSPTKVRIKSPYENKSHAIEEKRRRRLLEIRERREKKKLAVNENCKITKHKYSKGAIMAQASNSVTKLSITNKSFYNSIYGQTNTAKTFRNNLKIQKQDNIPDLKIQECDEDSSIESYNQEQDQNEQKYINRSYYLDDADTEVKYLQMKPNTSINKNNEILSPSTSLASNDVHLNYLSTTDFSGTETAICLGHNISFGELMENANKENACQNISTTSILVPRNTPKQEDCKLYKKFMAPLECKKRIDEIYDLMKNITASTTSLNHLINNNETQRSKRGEETDVRENNNKTLESDTGTNMKHNLMASNPNSIGIDSSPPLTVVAKKPGNKIDTVTIVAPKVVINSKNHVDKSDKHKSKRESKKDHFKTSDNPLKAISQLIHDIDNIQKTRHKSGYESKSESKKLRKNDNLNQEDVNNRQISIKTTSRHEKNIKQNNVDNSRLSKPMLSPEKGLKMLKEEKPVIKRLSDIIDEVKEMRGEAVRGPSKLSSRIDSLAQPKKAYVKAQHEEYQNRLNRNTPKVVKSTINSSSVQDKNVRTKYRSKQKTDASNVNAKQLHKTDHSLDKTDKIKQLVDSPSKTEIHIIPAEHTKRISNSFVTNAPNHFKKHISAIQTYLKDNYGQLPPAKVPDLKTLAQKSRVPLIPTDIDLASIASSPTAEESTTLGNKLHDMIHSKITRPSSPLTALTEYKEHSTSKPDEEKAESSFGHSTKFDTNTITSTSDFPTDIFKDNNIITAVACASEEDNFHKNNYQPQQKCLDNELHQLENALYHQMSTGAFQKRLKIKKLTLTPKQSMQQTFVLQGGDDKSLFVKTTISQQLDFSETDAISKLNNILPVISNDAINWKLPMQIATVGYVFPTYNPLKSKSKNTVYNTSDFAIELARCNKTVQCYKGSNLHQSRDKINDTNNNSANMLVQKVQVKELKCPLNKDNIPEKDTLCEIKNTEKLENISTSTSLDILVGLLNEIKKITTCQTNFVSSENEKDQENDNKELKVILDKATNEHSIDPSEKNSVSISSLENLLRVNSSNFFLNISSKDDKEKLKSEKQVKVTHEFNCLRPVFTNKEVDVKISKKEFVHGSTDVPSGFFPSTVNRSASVISKLLAVVTRPSEISSFCDCQTVQSKSSMNNIKTLLPFVPKMKSALTLKFDISDLQVNKKEDSDIVTVIYENEKHKNKRFIERQAENNKKALYSEFDSTLKFKRDVLVTVYSILVFTVFAALTFPDILFYA